MSPPPLRHIQPRITIQQPLHAISSLQSCFCGLTDLGSCAVLCCVSLMQEMNFGESRSTHSRASSSSGIMLNEMTDDEASPLKPSASVGRCVQ
jgi:hypothetical protein